MASGPRAAPTGRRHGRTDQPSQSYQIILARGAVQTWRNRAFHGSMAYHSALGVGFDMAADDSAPTTELDFVETLYGDPIRKPAVGAGRNLLIASLLLIAVVKFGARRLSASRWIV